MSSLNNGSGFNHPIFFLTGFPGLEASHRWISILFCSIYLFALLGNGTILFVIKTNPSLHEPMYIFLSMLAATDLGLSASTLPTVMGLLWFNSREISFNACTAQLFFIHTFSFMESSVLLTMAFDRYVAICNPLKYTSILTNSALAKIGLVIAVRSTSIVVPTPLLLRRYRYCTANVLSHSFCLHQDVLKLSCSNSRVNSIYGLCVVLSTLLVDSVLILLSYIQITKTTVLSIASKEQRLRALNTCISHICAVLTFYIPMIGLSMIHRYGKNAPPVVHILMAYIYLLVPPLMNPIVYSVKTKQIRTRIVRRFCKEKKPVGVS
uniref:Olfactory receptor n=1 Tax=Sphenodon punctatus TaxID=8508 RepID=A0A8D0H3M8_SPHPU